MRHLLILFLVCFAAGILAQECDPPPGQDCINQTIAYYKITAIDITALESDYSNEVAARIIGGPPQKIIAGNNSESVNRYESFQNYPNPFNPSSSISYSLEKDGFVTLKVYDMLGKEVAELVSENQNSGNYTIEFNAANLPSGIYIYQLQSGSFNDIKKMLLIK